MKIVPYLLVVSALITSDTSASEFISISCEMYDEELVKYYDANPRSDKSDSEYWKRRKALIDLKVSGLPDNLTLEVDKNVYDTTVMGFAKDVISTEKLDELGIDPSTELALGQNVLWEVDEVVIFYSAMAIKTAHVIDRTDLSYRFIDLNQMTVSYKGKCRSESVVRSF